MTKNYGLMGLALAATTLLAGCKVEHHKDGANDNVNVTTPFGAMSAKTNDADVAKSIGLSVYPGATLEHKDSDNGSADVNLSFGSFHLGVKATSYRTSDSPEKVIAFYRKDMGRYGAVILCKDGAAVGSPAVTQDGLSCRNDKDSNTIHGDESGTFGELKTGSKQKQHIVSVDREGSGTKFGLVALELPGHMGSDDDDNKQ